MSKTFDLSVIFRVIDKATGPVKKVGQALNNLTNPVNKVNRSFQELGKSVGKASEKMRRLGTDMSLKLTAPLMIIGGLATRSAIKFESAFAGVVKTVEATDEQLAKLKKQLMEMALRKPLLTEDIFRIAELAGQLGIATDDISGFSDVMADLAATTDLTSEDAAMLISQFKNFTNLPSKDVDRLASTIVGLGNKSATTESKIVNMMFRIGANSKQVGLGHDQIVALAASLASAGIEAEMGGSAFSKMLRDISKATAKGGKMLKLYGLASGKSAEQFKKDWKEKPLAAIYDLLEGFSTYEERAKKAGKANADLSLLLEALKLDAGRMSDVITRSANSIDKFRESGDFANKFWGENIALTEEANKKYATTESQLIMTKNRLEQTTVAYGDILKKALLGISKAFEPVLDFFRNLSPEAKTFMLILGGLAAVIGPILLAIGTLGGIFAAIVASPVAGAILAIAGAITILSGAVIGLVKLFSNPVQKIFDKLSNLAIFGLSKLGIGPDEETIRRNMAATKMKADIASGLVKSTSPEATGKATASAISENKSQTDINIKVSSDSGSTATVEKIEKKRGDASVKLATVGYVGGMR